MGKHCGAQVNVIVNVIVEKNKVAFIFPLVAYQIQNKRGSRFRTFVLSIDADTKVRNQR